MDNAQVAARLREYADLLDGSGESGYKARAYRTAAHRVATLPAPVAVWLGQGNDLKTMRGIGAGLAARIADLATDKPWPSLDQARRRREQQREASGSREGSRGQHIPATAGNGLLSELKGDLHAHTDATDGRDSLEDMALAAQAMGYEYLAITDHSKETRVAGGLDEHQMRLHVRRIRRLDDRLDGLTLLAGAEVDILKDGRLDFPDDLLEDLDIVLCSVHFRHKLSGRQQTDRILRAMASDHADLLTHPTGRRTGIRPGMDLDFERLFDAARDQGWAIEMNGSPERLDLDAKTAPGAAERGVLLALDSDAHATEELDNVRNACAQAAAAGIEAQHVLNARPLAQLRQLIRS